MTGDNIRKRFSERKSGLRSVCGANYGRGTRTYFRISSFFRFEARSSILIKGGNLDDGRNIIFYPIWRAFVAVSTVDDKTTDDYILFFSNRRR
jgi:hypothetical protein